MPVVQVGNGLVMSRKELAAYQRAGVTPPFPENEPERKAVIVYQSKERLLPSSRHVTFVEVETQRPKKYHKSKKYELVVVPSSSSSGSGSSRRYEVPPPSQFSTFMTAPTPMILPPPIPQPIVAEPIPPPAPEVPTIERRAPRFTRANTQSLMVEPPRSLRSSSSRRDSVSSPLSAGSTVSSRSSRGHHRRRSDESTPATSPARSQKEQKLIDAPVKGPKDWRDELRLKSTVVIKNADGTTTKQYYYR